jgi:hypothetical protein
MKAGIAKSKAGKAGSGQFYGQSDKSGELRVRGDKRGDSELVSGFRPPCIIGTPLSKVFSWIHATVTSEKRLWIRAVEQEQPRIQWAEVERCPKMRPQTPVR